MKAYFREAGSGPAEAFERAGERFHLVGHSYGGAIALKAALGLQPRLRSLGIPLSTSLRRHMAPVTHPPQINAFIERFLADI